MPEKMRSLRGCPDHEWQLAVTAAGNTKIGSRKMIVGEWIAEAIREKVAREREPIEGEIVAPAAIQAAPAPWWQNQPLTAFPELVAISLQLADQRKGGAKGVIQQDRLAALNRIARVQIAGLDPRMHPDAPALSHDRNGKE